MEKENAATMDSPPIKLCRPRPKVGYLTLALSSTCITECVYRWPNRRPGPAQPGTSPIRHGPFRHEIINVSCRVCPWAELPAQARPENDLIRPGRPVWPGGPKMFK